MSKLEVVIAALAHIEERLSDGKVGLDTVAEAVHYSKYHLHRIFSDTVQMNIHDYVQRRRLTEAANFWSFQISRLLILRFSPDTKASRLSAMCLRHCINSLRLNSEKKRCFIHYRFNMISKSCGIGERSLNKTPREKSVTLSIRTFRCGSN